MDLLERGIALGGMGQGDIADKYVAGFTRQFTQAGGRIAVEQALLDAVGQRQHFSQGEPAAIAGVAAGLAACRPTR